MEYQKIIKLLDNTQNEPSKFRNWVEINDESRGTYKVCNQIKFKTSMIRSNLCDYSDAYIPASGTITIDGPGTDDAVKRRDERNKGVIFKNCAPFTECISIINNTQIDSNFLFLKILYLKSYLTILTIIGLSFFFVSGCPI